VGNDMNAYLVLLQWLDGRITSNVTLAPNEVSAAAIAAATAVASVGDGGGGMTGCLVHHLQTEWLRAVLERIDSGAVASSQIYLTTLTPEGSA
jgi:hypothetical protein